MSAFASLKQTYPAVFQAGRAVAVAGFTIAAAIVIGIFRVLQADSGNTLAFGRVSAFALFRQSYRAEGGSFIFKAFNYTYDAENKTFNR